MAKKFLLSKHLSIISLLAAALILRFILLRLLEANQPSLIKLSASVIILLLGAIYILKGSADTIEETTEILSDKTKIASGLLQSIGTAFPDMVLGITAALISLQIRLSNYELAIEFAIIAAATTFGSNIYNIGYAIWCVFRQNKANALNKQVPIFPFFNRSSMVLPIKEHENPPSSQEIDTATDVLTALSALTAIVAIGMVLFGYIPNPPSNIAGDLYQLGKPIGLIVLILCLCLIFYFRKTRRPTNPLAEIKKEENYYRSQHPFIIWLHLILSGLAILLAAESMVYALRVFAEITGLPFVISGILAGVIGCLGEILVIHKYTTDSHGRLGDALVGIAMDNIITIMGASIIAIMGGIFLGGNSLILIFVTILALNSVLLWQISHLKNSLFAQNR